MVLWGAGTAILMVILVPRSGPSQKNILDLIVEATSILQGMFCFVGGLFSLLRHRAIARWSLLFASFCLAIFAIGSGWDAWFHSSAKLVEVILSLVLLAIALVIFCFGRWLGQHEDTEL